MSGYTASARIVPSAVHVTWCGTQGAERWWSGVPAAMREADAAPPPARPGRPLPERIQEASEQLREQWAITTFYLFDPESWR